MKKTLFSFLLFTIVTAGFCTKWTITNSGTTFSPATITIIAGDSVFFSIASTHNAVEVSQATWNANGITPLPGFSVGFGGGDVLPSQLTVGTHYYVCQAHASMGMKGTIIVQSPGGIKENAANINLSIFPNPSNGKFYFEINNFQSSKINRLDVYDLSGKKVYGTSNNYTRTSNKIDLSFITKGIYFIKLSDGREDYCKKIVIQ